MDTNPEDLFENYYIDGNQLTINRWMYSGFELNDKIFELFKIVEIINFDFYSKPLNKKLPSNIKKVSFECNPDYDISTILPDNLEELELLNSANFPLNNLPQNLKIIKFGSLYNQSLDNLPNSVEEIYFLGVPEPYIYFNKKIDNLPLNLKKLKLSEDFNQTIDNLPNLLEILILGYEFNECVDFLPISLKTLFIDGIFNQCLDNLPENLETLILSSRNYNKDVKNLPNLKILCWSVYDYKAEMIMPNSLETFIYLSVYEGHNPEIKYSKNLKNLVMRDYDGELINLPDSLEMLALGYELQFYNYYDNLLEMKGFLFVRVPLLPKILPRNLKKLKLSWGDNRFVYETDENGRRNIDILKNYRIDYPELEIEFDEFFVINVFK